MAECAHPLDVIGKILWIAGFCGLIATGVIFVGPVSEEAKYKQGVCNVSQITYKRKYCTGTVNSYLCVNFKGYYIKPTGYSRSIEYQQAVDNDSFASIITQLDTFKAKYVSSHWDMTYKKKIKAGREDCYVTFGNNGKQDYPCSTSADNLLTLDLIMTTDFPKLNTTSKDFYYNYTTTSYVYPNKYKYQPIIYQKCYYARDYSHVILYKEAKVWTIVYFFLCLIAIFVGIGLLVKFGEGAAHEFAKWIVSMIFIGLYIPFYMLNFLCYIVIALVAGFFCNYTMTSDLEDWISQGGIFRPFVKCWNNGCKCDCKCCLKSTNEDEHDAANSPTDDIEIHQAASAPDIVMSNPRTTPPPSPRYATFELPTELPPSNIEWEAPPPSYDEVMK